MDTENVPLLFVVTPTFRREDLLRRCVESVLSQEWDGTLEYTVVNDAGDTLSPADWMNDPRVRVVTTFQTERSVARNTGAALSRGEWLFFLDDDDYLLPGAFAALAEVARNTDAVLLYGGYRTENGATGETLVQQPSVSGDVFALFIVGEMLPIPALWVRRSAFWTAGGFDPVLSIAEDLDLLRRVSWDGTAAGTADIVSVARVEHDTSTTRWEHYRECAAISRDKCLHRPGVLKRLLLSARGRAYWRGRCARELLAAAVRDARAGMYGSAAGHLAGALRLSAGCTRQNAFRRGLRRLPEG